MMNRTILVGRMTRDPELKFSPSGVAICSFTIAVNKFGKKDEADFPSIVCFKKVAENTTNYCKKGSLVGIDGRLQTRTYDGKNGKVYVTEVIAESVQFLDSKKNDNPSSNQQSRQNEDPFQGGQPIDDTELPF